MNEITRSAYVDECALFMERWNAMIAEAGFAFRYVLPSTRFRRSIGVWAGSFTDTKGGLISREAFEAGARQWLPTPEDRAFVQSLMRPVTEPGKMASWIAPPDQGINGLPVEYQYVRR